MELLKHGLEHMELGSDFARMAMICIDNAVELLIKTYLGLPSRVTGIKGLSRKEYDEVIQSFPNLLDGLEKHAPDRISGFELADIEWYHRLRNQLYHEGNGVTVEKQKVAGYAAIAKIMCANLFGIEVDNWPSPAHPDTLTGEFLLKWSRLEKKMFDLVGKRTGKRPTDLVQGYRKLYEILPKSENTEFMFLRQFRNVVVHGQKQPSLTELRTNLDLLKKLNNRLDSLLDV